MDLDAARAEFDADVAYLDTATMGLPPRRSWDALQSALASWRVGTADAVGYDDALETCRLSYAALVGVDPGAVAVGSQVSVFAGLVAANEREGARVLTATGDFTSVTFPVPRTGSAAARRRGAARAHRRDRRRPRPRRGVGRAVRGRPGARPRRAPRRGDGGRRAGAARHDAGRRVAAGARRGLRLHRLRCVQVAAGAAGCGVPHRSAGPAGAAGSRPRAAPRGWYAGADRWTSIYGSPLRLASGARRFDVSPAWHSWVAGAPALDLLLSVGVEALHRHGVALANRLRSGLGLPLSDSAIASIAATDGAAEALAAARVACSGRVGRLRLACHLSTSEADVDRALDVLDPYVPR